MNRLSGSANVLKKAVPSCDFRVCRVTSAIHLSFPPFNCSLLNLIEAGISEPTHLTLMASGEANGP